jgi:hypothetical protein
MRGVLHALCHRAPSVRCGGGGGGGVVSWPCRLVFDIGGLDD